MEEAGLKLVRLVGVVRVPLEAGTVGLVRDKRPRGIGAFVVKFRQNGNGRYNILEYACQTRTPFAEMGPFLGHTQYFFALC
jgi:hypothetical protein